MASSKMSLTVSNGKGCLKFELGGSLYYRKERPATAKRPTMESILLMGKKKVKSRVWPI